MSYIVETDVDQLSEATTTLINMWILGARLPSEDLQSRWSQAWWDEVYVCILGDDVEGAVLATIDRGELDQDSWMQRLTVHTIEYLSDLSLNQVGLASLLKVKPEMARLVEAYLKYFENSRFLAVRIEVDRIGPRGFSDVLIALASALTVFPPDAEDLGDDDDVITTDDDATSLVPTRNKPRPAPSD